MSVRFVVDADGEEVIEHRDAMVLGADENESELKNKLATAAWAWKRMAERFRPFVSDPRGDQFHAGFLETDGDVAEWNSRGNMLEEFDWMMASPMNVPLQDALLEALDFSSTGRDETAAKAAVLTERGAHVSGFVLRPDDGVSDVAIVCNGCTRRLSPAEMQWLMHESHSPITMDVAGLLEENRRLARRLDEMTSVNMLQQAVVIELRAKLKK